jgi:hypothetical protein
VAVISETSLEEQILEMFILARVVTIYSQEAQDETISMAVVGTIALTGVPMVTQLPEVRAMIG